MPKSLSEVLRDNRGTVMQEIIRVKHGYGVSKSDWQTNVPGYLEMVAYIKSQQMNVIWHALQKLMAREDFVYHVTDLGGEYTDELHEALVSVVEEPVIEFGLYLIALFDYPEIAK